MTAALFVTASPTATLQQLTSLLQAQRLSAQDSVAVATNSGGLQPGALTTGALDTVVSFASQPGHHTVQLLGLIAAALKPGGKLVVQEDGTSEAALSKLLLLSGLASSGAAPGGGVAAIKPTWETGARASIALKPRQSNGGGKPAAAAAWKLAADDEEGDDELLDDEELLTEEDKQRPAPPPAADDCEVGAAGRKACKDCTCGRAEGQVVQVTLTKEMLENPTSGGCGSCGLGDAFRCGGCPYRGLPSFEMGKKIELPSDFLAMDL